MIWPWIERVGVFPKLFQEVSEIIPKEDFPKFVSWINLMQTDFAVKSYSLDVEKHSKYYSAYKNGTREYDPEY